MADKKTLELQIQVLMQQAQQQIKTFATDIKSAATQIKNLNVNNADVKKSIESVQAEAKRAATELKTFSSDGTSSISKLTKEIGTLAAVTAAVSFDKWVAGLAGSALSASTSFRAAKEDFGIMLGDMEAGAGLFAELQEFNFWTPFDLEQTSQAAKVLMAAKVPLKDVTEYLTRFGDISQGNGQRFQSFINAFSKASAKGKADMEVLNIYIDQGVQILDALGEQMGVTSAEIVDMASKGKVSFQDLDNALASLAAEGGLYYNSMATASQRLDAMQAGLEESVNALAASYGDMLAPMAAKALEVFTNLIDTINNSPFLKGVLAAALAAVVVIINTQMIRALVAFAAKIWATYAAQMSLTSALSITNPLLLAGIAAVATATAGYVAYAAAQQKATEATNEHALAKKQLDQAFKDSMANASATDAQLAIENYSRQIAMQKTILEQYKKQLTNTPAETWQSSASGYSTVKVANPEYKKIQDNIAATEQKIKDFEKRVQDASKRVQELQTDAVNAELERANEILAHRDQLYKSTTEYQREQVAQELEFAKSLRTIQTMNEDGTYSGFDKAKTEAIIRDLEEQMEKLTPKLGNEWQVKMLQGKDKVMHEWNQAIETLNQKGKNVFGEGFVNEPAFKAEMDALNEYFQKQIDNMKENGKISVSFGESASQAATDATSGSDLGIIISGIQNGEGIWGILFKIIMKVVGGLESFQKGINVITEALKKVFERIEPLIQQIMPTIEEIINNLVEALTPIMAILTVLGNSVLKAIAPLLNAILKVLTPVFEFFVDVYNEILVPFANATLQIVNGLIDIVNAIGKVFGFEMEHIEMWETINLEMLKTVENTQDLSDIVEKATERYKRQYQRMEDAVDEQLRSQLAALKSQYELGLISRDEYQAQAEKYYNAAEDEKLELQRELNTLVSKVGDMLEDGLADELAELEALYAQGEIDADTYTAQLERLKLLATDSAIGAMDENLRKEYIENAKAIVAAQVAAGAITQEEGENQIEKLISIDSWTKATAEGVATQAQLEKAQKEIVESVKAEVNKPSDEQNDAWKVWLAAATLGISAFITGFDVGSPYIEHDQLAMVHQGEIIVPRTFADGIRSGDLALSSKNKSGSSSINVVVNVAGSVKTEKELVSAIYTGIAEGIQSRQFTPLPA
nr:MAG TPA: tail tape measure protein [Caudoviricetes sp.]